MRRDAIEARARLCFRALAVCLAALVLIFISKSLQLVTTAFVETVRIAVDAPRAVPAQFPDTGEIMAATAPPTGGEPHAIVAVISVLLIGDVILAIGLIRATFSMQLDAERTANGRRENAGAVIGLPGVEVLRAVADALTTVIKGLPKP